MELRDAPDSNTDLTANEEILLYIFQHVLPGH